MSTPRARNHVNAHRPTSAERVFLAIDAGGTSTRGVVVTVDGSCIGYARSGPGNPTSSGPTAAAASLADVARKAVMASGINPGAVESLTIAMAGIDSNGTLRASLEQLLLASGIMASINTEADALAAYFSATTSPTGSVVISGTGAAALRIFDGQITATADGLGWLLGDAGSGFWIGRRVVRAALAALDGRGPDTLLRPALLGAYGLPASGLPSTDGRDGALTVILEGIYADLPVRIARFAPLAFIAADQGDDIAQRIIADAASGLYDTLRAVLPDSPAPIVIAGGAVTSQPRLIGTLTDLLRAHGCTSSVLPVTDGITGAAVLALRRAGVTVDDDTRTSIAADIRTLSQQTV